MEVDCKKRGVFVDRLVSDPVVSGAEQPFLYPSVLYVSGIDCVINGGVVFLGGRDLVDKRLNVCYNFSICHFYETGYERRCPPDKEEIKNEQYAEHYHSYV